MPICPKGERQYRQRHSCCGEAALRWFGAALEGFFCLGCFKTRDRRYNENARVPAARRRA